MNFIIWRIVDSYSELLGVKRKYLNDTRTRESICFGFALYNLHISANVDWVRKHFDAAAKADVLKIVTDLREEFVKILDQTDWLDNTTHAAAMKKANKMESLIAFPEEFLNDELLREIYENVSISETKLFENVIELNHLYRQQTFKALHVAQNRTDWRNHAFVAMVNAFYYPIENNISKYSNLFITSVSERLKF